MGTEKIAAALRRMATPLGCAGNCRSCPYRAESGMLQGDWSACDRIRLYTDAADRLEELVGRCARYAEEIAVLREKQKWVDAKERQPEYGVSVLAVASGKAANIALRDAITFATFWDSWELDDYPQAKDVVVKWWQPIAESPEGANCDG